MQNNFFAIDYKCMSRIVAALVAHNDICVRAVNINNLAFAYLVADVKNAERALFLVDEAIQNFALNFIKYVREVDASLYSRAKQYAADYSGNAVVEFIDDGEGDENENGD